MKIYWNITIHGVYKACNYSIMGYHSEYYLARICLASFTKELDLVHKRDCLYL